jgi:hypothetical protein
MMRNNKSWQLALPRSWHSANTPTANAMPTISARQAADCQRLPTGCQLLLPTK